MQASGHTSGKERVWRRGYLGSLEHGHGRGSALRGEWEEEEHGWVMPALTIS